MVLWSTTNNLGGEIFVPKIPSYNILDLAKAIGPSCKIKFTGIKIVIILVFKPRNPFDFVIIKI